MENPNKNTPPNPNGEGGQQSPQKKDENLVINQKEMEQVFEKAKSMQQAKEQRDKIIEEILSIQKSIEKKREAMIKKITEANKIIEKEKKSFEVFEKKAFEKAKLLQESLEKL